MNEISFNKTSNIFLNSGIISLYNYLQDIKKSGSFNYSFECILTESKLTIKCKDKLFQLLEDIYCLMGKEIYDTSGKKSRERIDKYYFVKEPFQAVPFYKMKTYGLGALITNDPAPFAKNPSDAVKFSSLIKEDSEFAGKIAQFYYKNNSKLKFFDLSENGATPNSNQNKGDSKIFLNCGYTKTTRLEKIEKKFFEKGDEKRCSLTGESYKKLVEVKNTSPFLSALNNFESHGKDTSRRISWKAMFLSRFSPKLALYSYIDSLDSLVCYFFNTDNLKNLNKLYCLNSSFYNDQDELIENNYMYNFKVYNFNRKKSNEKFVDPDKEYVGQSEILFMIIYTFYRQLLAKNGIEDNIETNSKFDPLEEIKIPVSLVSFKADKFASTMRPNSFENFNQFKFAISLISYLEKNGLKFNQILSSLKFPIRSDQNKEYSKKKILERILRNKIISEFLKAHSIIDKIEWLFYSCFIYSFSNDPVGYKNFKMLKKFVSLYEPIIKYGGNESMTPEIQEKAINLGSSLGMGIINFENPESPKAKMANAKSGRKYVISIKKARTLQQFLDEIIRIQNKYNIIVSSDLLKSINEENWEYIKQFALISALNKVNCEINLKK